MVALWRYFISGLNRISKFMIPMYVSAALLSITLVFMSWPWWIWGPLAVFIWLFMAPFTIYVLNENKLPNFRTK